jgi:hypothetical protein
VRKGRQLLVVPILPQWTSVEMGTLLCSDRAAYVSRTPAGRTCASARLAGSMLLDMVDVVDVVGAQQRARGQQQSHSPASKNSHRGSVRVQRSFEKHAPQLKLFRQSADVHLRPPSVQNMLSQRAQASC